MNVSLGPEGRSSVTLDGSGNGKAKAGPLTAREVWHPENAHVSASSDVNEAVCKIYAGDTPIDANFRDGTFSGSAGDSTDKVNADVIKSGQYIWAVWTGGDPGATATLIVTGSKDV